MSFKDEPWEKREGTLGDIAEAAFERLWGDKFQRYGLNRPDLDLRYVPIFVRYTPDYIAQLEDYTGNFDTFLVEVQGCGQDHTFKFKDEKIDALLDWDYTAGNVFVWLWDDTVGHHWFLSIRDLCDRLERHGVAGSFPEGKPYVSIETTFLDE